MKNVVGFSNKDQIANEAASWILRLEREDGLSHSEREQLKTWLDESSTHLEHFERLAKVWSGANMLTEMAVPLPRNTFLSNWFCKLRQPRQFVGVMATIIFICVLGINLTLDDVELVQENGIVATEIGARRSVDLADGSVLKLNTQSKVRIDYNEEFRNIYLLNGEAHFTVAKNKNRPFRVYAGSGRIHAIGTAFSVYLKENTVDVVVSEGRVGVASVAAHLNESEIVQNSEARPSKRIKSLGMLRAGEAGVIVSRIDEYSKETHKLDRVDVITEAEVANRISWTNGVLVFSGESLEDVVKEISRYTEVSIEFAESELKKIRIGGSFPIGETEAMFSSLETNFGLKVTRLDSDHVVISGAKVF